MSSTPALSAQLDLIEWAKAHGSLWAQWFARTYSMPGADWRSFESLLGMLNQAETVFVSAEMCDLIEKAIEDMPDVPLRPDNMMWTDAFVYFERPIRHPVPFVSGDDGIRETRAFAFFHRSALVQSETKDTSPVSKPGVVHITFVDTGDFIRSLGWSVAGPIFPFDLSGWTFGKRWETTESNDEAEARFGQSVVPGLAQQRKLLLAVNLLSAQYISLLSRERGLRQQRRRGERIGFASPNPGDITYITLRRARDRSESEGGEGVEYSHRFIVSGHWRHQFYPSRGEHELIYIHPYIKGPDEKPLVIKDRVYRVVR